jgi:hypothetical protein
MTARLAERRAALETAPLPVKLERPAPGTDRGQ